jgi:hypothetical protein
MALPGRHALCVRATMASAAGTRRRPALYTALAMATGILLDDSFVVTPLVWAAVALGVWLSLTPFWLPEGHPAATGLLLVLLVSAGGLRHHQVTALSPPGDVRHLHDWGRGELVGRAVGELQWHGEARRGRLRLEAES